MSETELTKKIKELTHTYVPKITRITHRISFSFTGKVWLHFCQNCEWPVDLKDKRCPKCGAVIVEAEKKWVFNFEGGLSNKTYFDK